jgi:hypothetical protein
MSKKEPNKMEDVDWEALENEDNLRYAGKDEEIYDETAIETEKGQLSEEEKSSPYPDDFLADINLLHKDINQSRNKLTPTDEEDDEKVD